jgi:hypothetical protein
VRADAVLPVGSALAAVTVAGIVALGVRGVGGPATGISLAPRTPQSGMTHSPTPAASPTPTPTPSPSPAPTVTLAGADGPAPSAAGLPYTGPVPAVPATGAGVLLVAGGLWLAVAPRRRAAR